MAGPYRYTSTAKAALEAAVIFASELGHTYVGSEHILLGLIAQKDGVAAKILDGRGVEISRVKSFLLDFAGTGNTTSLTQEDMTPRTRRILETASREAGKYDQNFIGTEHLLAAIMSEGDCVAARLLLRDGVSPSDINADIAAFFQSGFMSAKGGSDKSAAPSSRGKAQSGAKGDGAVLKKHGRDLTEAAREGRLDPVIGRDRETDRLISVLSRRQKNNPCLVGDPGVGKTAVVEGLALRIAAGEVPEILQNKTIVTVDVSSMIAGAKYRGEFEERLRAVMEEAARDKNLVLFLDEIHNIVGAGAAEGAMDAANIIKPALARGEMQVIGATTLEEYRAHIERDAALERRFQPVMINEPTPEESELILFGLRSKYETHHIVKISDAAVRAAVRLSKRYISDRFLPDKALDLIDEACAKARLARAVTPPEIRELEDRTAVLSKQKEEALRRGDISEAVTLHEKEETELRALNAARESLKKSRQENAPIIGEEQIAEVLTSWTGIPIVKLTGDNVGADIEEQLSRFIVGQETAVKTVADSIRRGRAGLVEPGRPIGSFLFVGPSGVGKTELAKTLSRVLFGSEDAMIRLDMSEYMEQHSTSKIIGSPPGYVGYKEGGGLTEKVRRQPYSLVLFDEIEKAHSDVLNILLQILDDGILTDSTGRRVDFANTVIIMTSNLGENGDASVRTGKMGFSSGEIVVTEKAEKERLIEKLRAKLSAEFLSRIDEIVPFYKLDEHSFIKITEKLLAGLSERLETLGIASEFSPELAAHLVSLIKADAVSGARSLRRIVREKIEDRLSAALLSGKIEKGGHITVNVSDGEIEIGERQEARG